MEVIEMNVNVELLREWVENIGYELRIQKFHEDDKDIRACVDKEEKVIYVDAFIDYNVLIQTVVHEMIHAVDDECSDIAYDDPEVQRACELRAEIGAQLFVKDLYIDDGYIQSLVNRNIELYIKTEKEAAELLKKLFN